MNDKSKSKFVFEDAKIDHKIDYLPLLKKLVYSRCRYPLG